MHIYSQYSSPESARGKRLNIGIVGAHGYSGMELGRTLLQHPYVESLRLGINESQINVQHWLPETSGRPILTCSVAKLIEDSNQLDVVFLATPAEVSMGLAPRLLATGCSVIDLSGAFRLENATLFQEWYHHEHSSPELLKTAIYGLSPFAKLSPHNSDPTSTDSSIHSSNQSSARGVAQSVAHGVVQDKTHCSARLIANPGCYATAVQMALLPLLQKKLLKNESIVIDAKSGTTGAGRKASESQLFAEVEGECLPYKIGRHQHYPEICLHLKNYSGQKIDPMFSTTLIPVRRGIIAGIYAHLQEGVTGADVQGAYAQAYEGYPLVQFGAYSPHAGNRLLSLKQVVGSARTHLTYAIESNKLYLYATIDNLMKGAATQAIENMNSLWGWPPQTGLLHREGLL